MTHTCWRPSARDYLIQEHSELAYVYTRCMPVVSKHTDKAFTDRDQARERQDWQKETGKLLPARHSKTNQGRVGLLAFECCSCHLTVYSMNLSYANPTGTMTRRRSWMIEDANTVNRHTVETGFNVNEDLDC
jgi:hypothetical protein